MAPAFPGAFFYRIFIAVTGIFLFLNPEATSAQQVDSNLTRPQSRLLIAEAGLGAASLTALSLAWYKDPPRGFHAFDDADEWLQMDKVGHMVTSYQILRINNELLSWNGIPRKKALEYSSLIMFGYMTGIEILDGFSPQYGASFSDLGANSLGLLTYYLQSRTNSLDLFTLKFSFQRSGLSGYRPELLGKSRIEQVLKDYNGQTYWVSMSPSAIMGWESFPKWLNVAFGYGANGLLGGKANASINSAGMSIPEFNREREWAFSLDFNLTRFFKPGCRATRYLQFVSFLKIPLPGVQFSAHRAARWSWFCY